MNDEQRKELEEKLKNMSPEELKEFQTQQCIFCQIVSGKIPSKKVYEDEQCIAILDINPAAKGHILLLPKEHYAIMPQMPDKELSHLYSVAKRLSQALLKGLKVSGTNLFVANGLPAGQRAQHFILHIIPRKEGDGLLEVKEKLVDNEMRTKVHDLIETKFNEIMKIKKKAVKKKDLPKKEIDEDSEETETEDDESVKEEVKKVKPSKSKKKTKEPVEEEDSKDIEETKKDEDNQEDNSEPEESNNTKEDKEKEESNASLDDIANLFK